MKRRGLSLLLVFAILFSLTSFSSVSADQAQFQESPLATDTAATLDAVNAVLISEVPDNIKNLISDQNADKILLASDPKEEAELFTLRTINSETGEGIITVHSVPVKYVDSTGQMQFIDTSMKTIAAAESIQSGFVYRNAANSFLVEFGNTASKGINFNNAFIFEANPNAASNKTSQIQSSQVQAENGHGKVIYPTAFGPNTKVEYINTENGLKENIILDKYTGQNHFEFTFHSDTHIPVLANNGANILVVDKNNPEKIEYRFLSLYAYDSYNPTDSEQQESDFRHMNEALYYELADNEDGTYTITVVVPEDYLTHPEIVYPVTIDPSITRVSSNSNAQDTFINAGSPNSYSYGNLDYIRFGKVNGYKNFGYHRFTSLPSLPSGANITSAYLKFTFRSGQTTPTASSGIKFWTLQVTAHQWYESSLTWNNQPYGSSGPYTSFTYNGSYLNYVNANITDIVRSWYNGSPNYGIDFTYSNEDYNDYNTVVSSEGESHRAPTLTINYQVVEPKSDTIGLVDGKSYFIKNVFSDKYIDVTRNYNDNFTPVIGYGYNGAVNQQWKLVNCGINKYKLVDVGSPTGKVLDVTGNNIDIYTDNDADYQKFTITRQENLLYGRSGQYYIQYGGKYLTLSTDLETLTLESSPNTYNGRSLWSFEMVSKGDADIFTHSSFPYSTTFLNNVENNFKTNCTSMGYRSFSWHNVSRTNPFNYLKSDSIWVHCGHGSPGYICFTDDNGETFNSLISYADVNALSFNELAGLRCFITIGCSSGANTSNGNNLINSVYGKGAQFALGWTNTTTNPVIEWWLQRFFNYSENGYTVKESIEAADIYAGITGMKYYMGDDVQRLSR